MAININKVVKLYQKWDKMEKENPEEFAQICKRIQNERNTKKNIKKEKLEADKKLREAAKLRKAQAQ